MEELIAFARIFAVVAGLAIVFALARRWRRTVLSIVGAVTVAGVILLGWSASGGVWAEPGKVHFGSPSGEVSFRIGFPAACLGAAVFLVGLAPTPPRLNDGSAKGFVGDILVRLGVTWVITFIVSIVVYTVVTGYVK